MREGDDEARIDRGAEPVPPFTAFQRRMQVLWDRLDASGYDSPSTEELEAHLRDLREDNVERQEMIERIQDEAWARRQSKHNRP